jgi:DNA polymerase-3 subunit delta
MESRIYLLYGTESYLIEDEIRRLTNSLIPPEDRELNLINYDLSAIPIEDVIAEAETPPFMSARKLIITRGGAIFTAQKPAKTVEHDLAVLEQYIDNPASYSTIVFVVDYDKLDERRRIVKQLRAKAAVRELAPLNDYLLIAWVIKNAELAGATISAETAQYLLHKAGKELQLLSQEIEKMALYVGSGGEITGEVVDNLTARLLENNIFLLIDAVANLRMEQAFQLLSDLQKNKEEPVKILSLLARQFRIILLAKDALKNGYSERDIASQLAVHPYVIKLALEQGRHFSEEQLQKIMIKLADLDYEIKSGRIDKKLAIEMFIFMVSGTVNKV